MPFLHHYYFTRYQILCSYVKECLQSSLITHCSVKSQCSNFSIFSKHFKEIKFNTFNIIQQRLSYIPCRISTSYLLTCCNLSLCSHQRNVCVKRSLIMYVFIYNLVDFQGSRWSCVSQYVTKCLQFVCVYLWFG